MIEMLSVAVGNGDTDTEAVGPHAGHYHNDVLDVDLCLETFE